MYPSLPSVVPSNLPVAKKVAGEVIRLPICPDLGMSLVDEIAGFIADKRINTTKTSGSAGETA